MAEITQTSAVRKCPGCGKELKEEGEFCPFCGNQIPGTGDSCKSTDPVRKALIHLTVALFTGTTFIIVLLGPVVPEIVDYYKYISGGEAQVPVISQVLLDASEEFRYNWYWYLMLIIPILLSFAFMAIRGSIDSSFAVHLADNFRPGITHLAAVIVWLVFLTIIAFTVSAGLPLLFPPGVIN